VVAVGTSVVRALETVTAADGTVSEGQGWTSLVVTPDRGLRAIDGLLTGWHESESSHLACSRPRPVSLSASAPTGLRSSTATSGTSSATCT